MNGDILTTSDFGHFCAYHKEQGAAITVGGRARVQIPTAHSRRRRESCGN
jgi:NDP-sugar pyrophosphorylase family protein